MKTTDSSSDRLEELQRKAEEVLEDTAKAVREIRDRILDLPVKTWFGIVITGRVNDSVTRSWNVTCHFVDWKREFRDDFLNLRADLANGVGIGCAVEIVEGQANIVNVSLTKANEPIWLAPVAEEIDAFLNAVRDNIEAIDEAYSLAWVSSTCKRLRDANVSLYHIERMLCGEEEEDSDY